MVENEILPIQAMAQERNQLRTIKEIVRLQTRHVAWLATFVCKL